ncbi:MAG TPA: hypothetical protein VMZ06_13515 [Candidatus Bathyarchaeia archaeon]|nr:hypothetical protein [Candidatus Bathyarchaeia archaeon]
MNQNSEPNGPPDAAPSIQEFQELNDLMAARAALGARLSKVLKVGMVLSAVFVPICFALGMFLGFQDDQSVSGAILGGVIFAGVGLWEGPAAAALYWGFVRWGMRERLHMEFIEEHRRRGYLWAMPGFYDYNDDTKLSLLVLGIEVAISPFTFLIYLWRWWRMTAWIKAYARFPDVRAYLIEDGSFFGKRFRRALIGYPIGTVVIFVLLVITEYVLV